MTDNDENGRADGMRFVGDLMGYWAYNDALEPKYTTPEEFALLVKMP